MSYQIRVSDAEEIALQGLRLDAQLVYLRGIAPFVDYQTGLVGTKRGISRQSLLEVLEVLPKQGSQTHKKATVGVLRACLNALVSAGLIERKKHPRGDVSLCFFLPKCDCALIRSKKERPKNDRPAAHVDKGFPCSSLPEERPTSMYLCLSTNQSSSKTVSSNTPPNTASDDALRDYLKHARDILLDAGLSTGAVMRGSVVVSDWFRAGVLLDDVREAVTVGVQRCNGQVSSVNYFKPIVEQVMQGGLAVSGQNSAGALLRACAGVDKNLSTVGLGRER